MGKHTSVLPASTRHQPTNWASARHPTESAIDSSGDSSSDSSGDSSDDSSGCSTQAGSMGRLLPEDTTDKQLVTHLTRGFSTLIIQTSRNHLQATRGHQERRCRNSEPFLRPQFAPTFFGKRQKIAEPTPTKSSRRCANISMLTTGWCHIRPKEKPSTMPN